MGPSSPRLTTECNKQALYGNQNDRIANCGPKPDAFASNRRLECSDRIPDS